MLPIDNAMTKFPVMMKDTADVIIIAIVLQEIVLVIERILLSFKKFTFSFPLLLHKSCTQSPGKCFQKQRTVLCRPLQEFFCLLL